MKPSAGNSEVDFKSSDVEVEAYTDGSDRRAHARGRVKEIAPSNFLIIPTYLREISGPDVRWCSPSRGMPISTTEPITSFEAAGEILKCWAMKTFAEYANRSR